MRRYDRLSHTFISFLFVTLVVCTVFGARFYTEVIEERIRSVRSSILASVQERTAQEITWEAISPSILRSVTFYGVSISRNITARRVSLGLNYGNIIRRNGESPISSVVIAEAFINLTAERQWNRLERTATFATSLGPVTPDLTIRFRDSHIIAQRDEQEVRLSGIDGAIELSREGTIRGDISGQGSVASNGAEQFIAESDITLSFRRSGADTPLEGSVDLREIRSSHFNLQDQSFHVETTTDGVVVQRVKSATPLDLTLRYNGGDGEIRAEITTSSLVPAQIVTLQGPWADADRWLHNPVSGSVDLTFHESGAFLSGSGEIGTRISRPDILPAPVGIRVSFRSDGQTTVFPSATLYGAEGTITFEGSYRNGDLAPNGRISASGFQYADFPVISGAATVSGGTSRAGFSAEQLRVDDSLLYHLVGSVSENDNGRKSLEAFAALDSEGTRTIRSKVTFADVEDFTERSPSLRSPRRSPAISPGRRGSAWIFPLSLTPSSSPHTPVLTAEATKSPCAFHMLS